ncbi:mitogen-activated protein kinase kinase kinase 4 isoform X2 [Ceratitis capitata]|uniref:mitogen-activated protein kinase kinase kinase 4 isoform X2 n=1 Tax=Ceratitis capitata TaxID=7213 RepID=UPI00032A1ACE|nr:mitogen-activated protein kinase kinase kinase 4 isoform X2 [Ceratitis capitata]XP_012156574.1 mitogen-activated protein kinase kinase kinase 4 isoform X2 [Ceratitis capitata]XP_012156575.1 mitogen-activated protein kinase kinase kinase 4 isoform X2 [Ceratitis capitata]XP_020714019.1 mitogen-activated protein kinase kinase kinase 4 isoform X2 [Ceratitis capitata]
MRRKKVEFRIKPSANRSVNNYRPADLDEELLSPHTDDLAARFEDYGTTPPRTRMKIKSRDWERKKAHAVASVGSAIDTAPSTPKKGATRLARSRVLRRNTMDCALLNEMFVNEENKRTSKRAQDLLRDAERELKNSMISATATSYSTRGSSLLDNSFHLESMDKCTPLNSEVGLRGSSKVVESCNRYMCVSSRPIGYRASAPASAFALQLRSERTPGLNIRKEFHETFANLIKLGSVDRQDAKLSHEEHTWQAELKDLIWLELQAWQADRTMEQQDKYLFNARQAVPELLSQIINYKFQPRFQRAMSEMSVDSGISTDSNTSSPQPGKMCTGCMSLYCKDCMDQHEIAMREVEELLTRLEAAEALYPSSQVMGAFHPIYKNENFVGRIKAMCLWYNITRQNQLKLCSFGKILARLQSEKFSWPVQTSYAGTDSGTSSGLENDDSGVNSVDSTKTSSSQATPQRKLSSIFSTPKVQFMLNDVAQVPGETSSSNESTSTEVSHLSCEATATLLRKSSMHDINIFSVEPLASCNDANSSALYRKFIENVLKSRGLAKALSFLNKLHNVVLYKAHISLEKPGTEDYDFETERIDEDVPRLEPEISREQIDELRRFGYWSDEAKSINLPTYIPSFVFLSGIPLQFMHEFLRMRLETRPPKPNPLSLEQLMKELREGLTLALTHRERYQRHITTALVENEVELERYIGILNHFDKTVRKVFELYLDYIDQLVLQSGPEGNKKSALEKEWMFTKLISPMINGMHTIAAKKFCTIIRNLLRSISDRLVSRASELDIQIDDTAQHGESDLKWQLLTICRETQSLFTIERERSVKVLFFAKMFCRDVETTDFHREHYEDDVINQQQDFVCAEIKKSFKLLQKDILDVRNKLSKIIERVMERCCPEQMSELDDQDRQAVLSRTREILHQGYKFGFEYNKDVIRLFEQRIMANKDESCEVDLALGIIDFAKMWMHFVMERCERGRGMRPRWASQGLEFLILACDPQITRHLDERQFEDLKKQMDRCISHVIGITSEPEKIARKKASPRTRKTSSPATSRSRTPTRTPISVGTGTNPNTPLSSPQYNKFLHPQFSLKEEVLRNAADGTPEYTIGDGHDSPDYNVNSTTDKHEQLRLIVPQSSPISKSPTNGSSSSLAPRQIRVRDAVNRLDMEIEENLRERNLIGHIKALNTCDKVQIRARSVNFHWHRGIKIGQGRFGKVYTAVNNNTGELMAMKEIAIQPGETRALKNVAEELKILEGIKHKNLVRYYGIEVHREELLIFMELCSEGTLEALVELSGGLPEGLVRRFTAQLLSGVAELHRHGIVHRDIKTANIFLVDGSNSLKLGDFGSAVKIQAHTTVPGELQGYVGTQAYMAPEIFTKTNSDGHGRAADIWSVGCVVVEMASGQRPWAQFDSNFQIMFKVGMGEKPEAPESLSQEGHEFVDKCLQHDPKDRMTALELLEQNFCKYGHGDELNCDQAQHEVRRSFRRNVKFR